MTIPYIQYALTATTERLSKLLYTAYSRLGHRRYNTPACRAVTMTNFVQNLGLVLTYYATIFLQFLKFKNLG